MKPAINWYQHKHKLAEQLCYLTDVPHKLLTIYVQTSNNNKQSRDSSFIEVTDYRLDRRPTFESRQVQFVLTWTGAHASSLSNGYTGLLPYRYCGRSVKLITRLRLVPR